MSSLTDSVTVLTAAETYLYQVGGPILMLAGTVSCILNLLVFTQKNLRKNPCSIYFIAYNLANFIYIYSSLLSLTIDVGYHTDPSAYSLALCHLRLYVAILFNCLSPTYLILASFDRILITSSNALTRQRSTPRLAYICTIVATLFWVSFHSHALVLTNIVQLGPNLFLCYFQGGVYLTFISYYSLLKEILSLSLMLICGIWSIKNIRSLRRVTVASDLSVTRTDGAGNLHSHTSKDRQMMFMLLLDISVYAVFSFIFAIFLIYQQITENQMKSFEQVQIEGAVRNICLFSIGIPFCISGYTNLIASKTFRKEVKKIFARQE